MNSTSINETLGISLVATIGILALFVILVIFQRKEHGGWLGWSAMSLELLGGALAISWGADQSDGLLKVVFVGGIIGLALAKATIINPLIKAGKQKDAITILFGTVSMLGAYGLIYAAGAFAGGMNSAGKAAEAAQASAPIVAIDAQLQVARDKLTNLSQFADSGKASSEASKAASIQTRLNAAQAALAACPANYITKCINPNQAKVDALQGQLSALTYHSGNQSYSGTKQLIADLETQKADLLSGGAGAMALGAVGADDRMISMLFGISEEKARQIKWVIFVAAFDVISLFFRLFGERSKAGISQAKILGMQFESMMNLGYSQQAAAALIGGNSHQLDSDKQNDKALEDKTSMADTSNPSDYPQENRDRWNQSGNATAQKQGFTGFINPNQPVAQRVSGGVSNHAPGAYRTHTAAYQYASVSGTNQSDYERLKALIVSKELSVTYRPIKAWMREEKIGSSDKNRQELTVEYLDRMFNEGVLILNPANTTGMNKAKYVLA